VVGGTVLIRVPQEWPQPLVATLAMVVLAVLDLAGAVAAKEAAVQRSVPYAVLGAVSFLALFWVYASSLQYAELAPVTFGWIVFLQVALVALDRLHYGVSISPGKWVAIVVILAAQAYLVLGPAGSAGSAEPAAAAKGAAAAKQAGPTVPAGSGQLAGAEGEPAQPLEVH
jgi:hypothetical protein